MAYVNEVRIEKHLHMFPLLHLFFKQTIKNLNNRPENL